jgi:hypothetical protein
MPDLLIRVATDDDVAAAGALTAQAYHTDGLVSDGDDYVDELMDAVRRAREASLLVALTPTDARDDAGSAIRTRTTSAGVVPIRRPWWAL